MVGRITNRLRRHGVERIGGCDQFERDIEGFRCIVRIRIQQVFIDSVNEFAAWEQVFTASVYSRRRPCDSGACLSHQT